MKQFVVYTALTGGYDDILQPLVVDDRFDYILFTDNVIASKIGIWEVRDIPYRNEDRTRVSRYPKMQPEKLLSEYEASLYIDANMQITAHTIYDRFVELYESGCEWGTIKHSLRDCIYDEAYHVMALSLEREKVVFEWCHQLRKNGYPCHNGLFENGIIFRTHSKRVQKIDDLWWDLYQNYTRRDQLTLKYVFWNLGMDSYDYILPSGESVYNSVSIRYVRHNKQSKATRIVKNSLWEHFRNRCRMGLPSKQEAFQRVHYFLYQFPVNMGMALLNLWTIYAIIVYGPRIKYEAYLRHKGNK